MNLDAFRRSLNWWQRRLLPKSCFGDKLFSLQEFYQSHGRLPRATGGDLNDAIFYLKADGEVEDPLRVFVTDKVLAKHYIRSRIGDEYNIATEAVLESKADVTDYTFPSACVIKATHMSRKVVFRVAGERLPLNRLCQWFDESQYARTREANYKALKPKIIVEPFVFGRCGVDDYKILCVDSEPRVLWVDHERGGQHTRSLYTPQWEYLPYRFSTTADRGPAVARPAVLGRMLDIARELSAEFSFIRVDLYTDGREVRVGELTNTSGNGHATYCSGEAERHITRLLFGPDGYQRGSVPGSRAPSVDVTARLASGGPRRSA